MAPTEWPGTNFLGECMMRVRARLRAGGAEDVWLFDKAKVDVNDCCLFYGHKKEEQVSAGTGTGSQTNY